ncbi:MAG: tungsten formylmethanofuran dehydrogenase [Flavobacteriales bacterium]|nr:tungsten formylmethanofuran dehydrogenase [Flavobacteriales bacterium]|tara:strand:+ start:16371 stop:18422 length:2052 start_codon:yes stop_codon:yes gene_type:complete
MSKKLHKDILEKGYSLICTARELSSIYEENKEVTSKYVHATSKGHEAIQLAVGLQLTKNDWVAPYYRDDAMLLGIGITPYELMLQLFCKKDDPFSGGRTYYSHPSLKRENLPKIPHQSSATGMQGIPTTGVAMGIQYKEKESLVKYKEGEEPVTICSFGDAAITEGEVAEAFQMAALKQLPILYLVQDNEWDISAHSSETRAVDATHYAKGFGLKTYTIDGTDFTESYNCINKAIKEIREKRSPILVHAKVPLLNHHTSGVRMEWYRDDLDEAKSRDPLPKLKELLLKNGFTNKDLSKIEETAKKLVKSDYDKALNAKDPNPEDLFLHDYSPTTILEEKGERSPKDKEPTLMVDSALFAIKELMTKHPECLLYGQDVGEKLGGVFREAATLAETFGKNRVFNTPIQEAFIIGSTVGMSAVGLKPIVEVQFADYIWPGLNQLFTEVSRSNYLSNGKWPVSCIIRVPIGAYGSGGPYHSSSVESVLTNIKGIKIAYPSNGADLKGLMKSAYYDPNPVVILEHKGLYWSKMKGTENAKTIEPSSEYVIPFGKGRIVLESDENEQNSLCIITYGMGVHWALNAANSYKGKIEIIDLRTINPIDDNLVFERVKKHGKCLVLTEEPYNNSFAQALSGRIQENTFKHLDAPIFVLGSENLPAIPLNSILESTMLPNTEKISAKIEEIFRY